MRSAMVDVGFKAQRLANRVLKVRSRAGRPPHPAATHGPAPVREQVIHFINKRKMPGGLPKITRAPFPTSRIKERWPRLSVTWGGVSDHRDRGGNTSPAAAPSACSARSAGHGT